MAGNGGEKNAHKKKCTEQNAGFGGEMDKSAARGHEESPHLIIRIQMLGDFKEWYRGCSAKNWPEGQGEGREIGSTRT
jgi:hypothetical protein